MSENQIRVVITGVASDLRRALDGAKGDLGGLKAAIKDVPNKVKVDVQAQTALATERLKALKEQADGVREEIKIHADADTGVAEAKLRLLERQAHQTEEAIARAQLGSLIPSGGGGAGGGAGGLGGILGGIPGQGGGAGGAAVIAGAPLIAAGAGSLTALAGSAGAGVLGAGALGTAALGVGGVGLGSMLAVLIPAKTAISNVSTAMDALEKAQSNYGAKSKEAAQAQQNLNTAMAEAGPQASVIAKQLSAISDQWQTLSAPATKALDTSIITPGLKALQTLLPTIAGIAKQAFDAIGKALQPVFAGLSSPAFKRVLTDLGDAFAKLAPPTIGAFSNLMRGFVNIAIAAAPFLQQIAVAFQNWTRSFADATAPGKHMSDLIGGLVGQLKSWWELAKSIGGLMVTIFSAGAGTGKGLVDTLTGIVRQWNAWLNTKTGQEGMKTFFKNSADLVKALFSALGPLAGALGHLIIALMPAFTQMLKDLTPAVRFLAGVINAVASALSTKLAKEIGHWLNIVPYVKLSIGVLVAAYGALKDAVGWLGDAWKKVWEAMKATFDAVLSFVLGGLSTLIGAIAAVVSAANIHVTILGHTFGANFDGIVKSLHNAQHSIDDYRGTLKPTADTTVTQTDRAAKAHENLRDRQGKAVKDMVGSTVKGLGEIDKLLNDDLKAMGVKGFTAAASVAKAVTGGITGLFAGGGLVQIGREGERGRDAIPLSVGGTNIVVGAGEQVAVFNAEQQQVMNQRLGDMGGLPGMFARHNRPHHMAQGGLLGNIPAMIARANFDTSLHRPYLWGGGHGGFDNGPWDCSGAVSDILHAGGVLNAPRVSGDFMSYGLPGPGQVTLYANPTHVYMSIDGRFFGTSGSNPGGGAGWFAGAPRPGFAVRHIGGGGTGAGGFGQIAAPKWTGPGGALGQIGKGALAKATAGANQNLSAAFASAAGGQFGGGQPSENGPVEQQVFSYFSAQGFNKVAIAGMLGNASQESSMNPSAPGGGLWQQISNFGSGAPPLQVQMATMLPQILGLRAAMNAAGSPGEAARIFMEGFERPGIPALANRIAGANAAFAAGFAGGGRVGPRAATPTRPAKRPPAASKHKHPKTAAHHAPFIPKDALKGLLSPDQLRPDRMAAAYDRQVTVDDQRFTNLLAAQAVHAVDDPPLVTLTDADVAALDPAGTLGYQAGDQIANRDGMTVGRFFGPGGRVQGGSFHPGASTRMGQLAAILANRRSRLTSLYNEEGAERAAIGIDKHALARRQARKQRIERFLHQSVVRAGVVKSELDVLKSKNLAQALRDALSKQAIGKRLGGLRSHLRTVSAELTAERRHQAAEIPIARDPTHTQALEAQAAGLRDSIAVESELGRSGAGTVQKAQSAIFAHDLTKQLTGLEATNRTLGGQALSAGTGGLLGTLTGQMKTIGSDRDTRQNTLADFLQTQIIPARAEIASYVREQTDLGKLSNIQVRTPDTTAAAPGPDLAALNQLLQTQLATTRQDLAISQSQFEVLQGFAPLLEGRLVGSFASGIDFVPRTGMAIVHKGETILPDPAGPYGNRAAATVHTSQGPVQITILMGNNEAPLMKVIDARMNQRSLQVVSDHGGQRARLLSGVRRP